jgi:uncharacterized membrane protein
MLYMKILISAGLMLAAPTALAAQDAKPAPAAAESTGLSEAGATLYRDYQATQKAELTPLLKRRAELQGQFDALMKPDSYDDARLTAAMTELRNVEGQIVEKQGNALLNLLRSFSAPDRAQFLGAMSRAPGAAPARRPSSPPGGTGR